MTNVQNIRTTISQLRREKRKLEIALRKAEDQDSLAYEKVLDWEETYMASGEDEEIGQKLDEAYDEYNEANRVMWETEDKLKSIKEAIEALCKAVEAIRWMGL